MLARGMNVSFAVRMRVMIPVVSSPPERAFLCGRTADPRQDELRDAPGFERAVGKITVVSGGDAEFSDEEQRRAHRQGGRVRSGPKRGQAGQVDGEKSGDVKRSAGRYFRFNGIFSRHEVLFRGRL